MSKFFQVNPKVEFSDKKVVTKITDETIAFNKDNWEVRESKAGEALEKECRLKHTFGRVIVKMDIQKKNRHTFSNGTTIRRERGFNNFNFREVNPCNAIVVSSENMPIGAEVIIDYTSFHDSNKIFDYDSGSIDIEFYSVKEDECYAWKIGENEWQPTKGCEFGLRVYKPHEGRLSHVTPERLKEILYVTTGSMQGFVIQTVRGSDYQMVFTDDNGKEGNIIRFRHSDEPNYDREEVICIHNEYTDLVNEGKLLIGLEPSTATKLNQDLCLK